MFKKNKNKFFDFKLLNQVDIGALEGETDHFLREDTFIITASIAKALNCNKYNYIVGSFGSGKSAFFKAVQKKYIVNHSNEHNKKFFKNKNIICLNESFKLDSNVTNHNQLSQEIIIINWSIYLLKVLISDIINNHKEKKGYNEFVSELSFYEELKSDFDLHTIKDWIKKTRIEPAITISGTPIKLALNLKLPTTRKEINLNYIYKIVNEFYEKNDLNTWILIDRIDDFVRFSNYEKRKVYIQALHEVVEEIRTFLNIRPMLFLREDLFKSIYFTTGTMKVKDRVIYLTWTSEEILNFLFRRVCHQKIFIDYNNHFQRIINNNKNTSKLKNLIFSIFVKLKLKENKKYNSFEHKLVKELLFLILPPVVKINGQLLEFEDMLNNFLLDRDFINPRVIICFINMLNEKQYNYYLNNPPEYSNKKLGIIKKVKEYETLNIYTNNCIKDSLVYTKTLLLEHIQGIFPDKNIKFKNIFFKIDDVIQKTNNLEESKIFNLLKFDLSVQQIKFVIHYLLVVKYFYRKGKTYQLSNVYKKA